MEELNNNPIFLDNSINKILTTSPEKLSRTTSIYDYIKEHAGCTCYEISKVLKINYTDVSRSVDELHFSSMIIIKVSVDENNRAKKLLYAGGSK